MDEGDPESGTVDDATTSPIHHLDERTVQRIAAGEVVERPASVVKELVENAIDADADRIAVSVTDGGTSRIRVRDDGVGIPPSQLPDSVAEHATSKIDDIADLDAGVGTLGFRGEALYTIGAVSRLTVRSRPRSGAHGSVGSRDETTADSTRTGETGSVDDDVDVDLPPDAGAELTVDGGDVGDVQPAGCPVGTTVEVADLFFNTPARRKFLKTDATEFDHVNRVVTQYALANPDVAVSLEHNGRETFATQGTGNLESAVLAVYGRDVATSMIPVDYVVADQSTADSGTALAGTPVERVHGLVSHPETTRANREYLSTFVNDRYVTASLLRNAVVDAYGGQLASDRYPFAVLFIELPAETIDVNVHPRKLEIRFDEPTAVRETVTAAVESALLDHGVIRSTAPRGRSAPGEATISPGADPTADSTAIGGAGTQHERAAADAADTASETADETAGKTADETADETAGGEEHTPRSTADTETEADAEPTTDSGSNVVSPTDADAWAVTGLGDAADAPSTTGTTASDETETETETMGSTAQSAAPDAQPVDEGHDGAPDAPSPRRWQSTDPTGPTDTDRESDIDQGRDAGAVDDSTVPTRQPGSITAPTAQGTLPQTDDAATDPTDTTDPTSATDPTDETNVTDPTTDPATADGAIPPQRGGTTAVDRRYASLPPLRILGQHRETYVVAESPAGLVLIDQHAADERVNYERLQDMFADGAPAQALAEPVSIEVTAREAALFTEFRTDLADIGFRVDRAGDREIVVEAVPAVFDSTLDPALVRDVLGSLVDETSADDAPVSDVIDDLLADLACYPSVTGNTSLTEGSIVDLLAALDDCENPYACPHGRPVIIAFDDDEVADRFERDYPGHAGRRHE